MKYTDRDEEISEQIVRLMNKEGKSVEEKWSDRAKAQELKLMQGREEMIQRLTDMVYLDLEPRADGYFSLKWSSYRLKHMYEQILGEYILEGELMQSMVRAGFKSRLNEYKSATIYSITVPSCKRLERRRKQFPVTPKPDRN